jgi:hypothetical protein
MATPTKKSPNTPSSREAQHDQRTELVRGIVARENAELDARTARLAALRRAKEAEDKLAMASHPAPEKPRRKRNT